MKFLTSAAERFIGQGSRLFSLSVAAYGILNIACAHSVYMGITNAPHLPVIPWVRSEPWLAYLTGLIFLIPAMGLVVHAKRRFFAILLGIIFVAYALTLVPFAATRPLDISLRTILFETLSMGSAAIVLAGNLPEVRGTSIKSSLLDIAGRILFASCLVVFGIDHLLMLGGIAALIPFWIPFRLFWASFTAIAFIASGISIATGWHGRLGAFLIGLMFLIWVSILHGPRTFGMLKAGAGPRSPAEWSSLFIALAICGASWICAESLSPSRELGTIEKRQKNEEDRVQEVG